MSAYVRSAEIVRRLQLELPIEVELPDPWTGEPFVVKRSNILAMLTIDSHNLVFEAQPIPPLFAEAGRAARAAEYQAELAEIRYRKWKAQKAAECRKNAPEKKTAKGAKAVRQGPTGDEITAFYQLHEDYEEMSGASARYRALAGLFSDIRLAFKLKGELQQTQTYLTSAHEKVMRQDDNLDRLKEIESLEVEAEKVIAASGSAKAAADYAAQNT